MLRNSLRLFTVGGIEVGVHVSWLIIFALVTWSLATGLFPALYRDSQGQRLDEVVAWILGGVAAILLFASVLVHELAHSFMARARGLQARSITLFLFGGVSNLAGESREASTEFLVAVVGPLSSFAISGIAFGVVQLIEEPLTSMVLSYLAFVNLLVGAFNLIPGYPLDGGRLLRSIVWKVTGSMRRATVIAAGVGQLVGYALIAFGVWILVTPPAGDSFSGLWMAAIGWFLQSAAASSVQQLATESRLRDVRVSQVLRRDATAVTPQTTVAELIEEHLLPRNRRAMPVCTDGMLVGIVTLHDIRGVRPDQRATTPVGSVMTAGDALRVIRPQSSLSDALEAFGERDVEQVPVVEDGRFLGLITRADVVRQLQLRETLGLSERDAGDRPA